MTRSALKPEAPVRHWWTGRCECGALRAGVEVGEGDTTSRQELETFFGYMVSVEPGPLKFQAHAEGCANKEKR